MPNRKWSEEEVIEYRKRTNSIFYFNKQDSNVFVPKHYGFGKTLNFANPVSWALIALMIAFLIWVSRY